VAAAPVGVRKSKADAKPQNPLYEKRSKNFGESCSLISRHKAAKSSDASRISQSAKVKQSS